MPRRSTGCEGCRKRKVRCDEGKPQCQKCSDYGITCPGYRPSADRDLRFVDQTTHVVQKTGDSIVPYQQASDGNARNQYRWRHNFQVNSKPNKPGHIDNRQVHRIQLLSTFLDLYLPKRSNMKRSNKSLTSNFDYIAELPHIDLASPLLQTSIDALCLAELGSLYREDRCLRESQARYTRALPMLANELARPPSRRMRSDHILAAITVLTLCELFDGIARGNDHGQGWISHVHGAQQYIKAIGPSGIDTDFGWHLFQNIRHQSMCMGFVKRRAVFFAAPEWLKITEELAKHDQYVALYDITLQIPGVLERIDILPSSNRHISEMFSICQELCQLRDQLRSWFGCFYSKRSVEPCQVVLVRDMEEFASLCLDRTFQTVFSFDSVQSCSQQQLYWVCSLILDFQLLAIHQRLQSSALHHETALEMLTSRSEQDIERDMFIAATSYCRSLPFCCEPEVASVGRVGTFLLRIVQNYFEQRGHCRESEWCNAVRSMLHSYSNTQTGVEHTNDIPGAPWKMQHSCKSPICNFRVECVAPAPLLLAGEYPNNGYKPRHESREVSFDQPTVSNCGRCSLTNAASKQMHLRTLPAEVSKVNGASALADERVLAGNSVSLVEV